MTRRNPNYMFRYLYDICLIGAFIIALPKLAYKMCVYGKYKKSLFQRFALKRPKVPGTGPLAWFHGASVGELRLLLPVIEQFCEEFPHWRCLITSCTESGFDLAKQLFDPKGITTSILPLDFSLIIKPVVRKLSPALLVFSEGDCWLNFFEEAKRLGATTLVINGRMSEKSVRNFKILRRLGKNYFASMDRFLLQDEVYRERFLAVGIPESKLRVTGNIKTYLGKCPFIDLERKGWRERLRLPESAELVVLGSMHPTDAEKWLPVVQQLIRRKAYVLWVPRHIEKTKDLQEYLSKGNIPFGLWSRGANFHNVPVVVVDEIGWLKELYFAGDLAFVGGTFDSKIGGHNLLEPLQCGVPLIFGPHITSQSELAQRLLMNGAGLCLDGTKSVESVVMFLLDNPKVREAYIEKGKIFLSEEGLAFERTWAELKDAIPLCKNT
ncbi:lipid IV(A) 3-deoxy-D-manno-octulosonic acid transferase [Candidatus Chlamydia sanziniae]|uniref:3-deoxy-D-manno-octulosonic acid transferase n=1 Tax=Candidatus Chlamydia sanziniae TaxID=1806891 RepID=A0A1A9HVB7_9CHLA|nr:lipid IV(A) 3-deoxy-D-manno-octulosonic acid transferase [Candidatus Chlamydia sanziniae]ANH78938.1 Lipid IVA 3-deoxy-D-manno-octulosonic acid transferase [Candidatus Chlamydia sanziniae]